MYKDVNCSQTIIRIKLKEKKVFFIEVKYNLCISKSSCMIIYDL